MPVNAEGRKYLTELLAGYSSYSDDTATNFNFDSVTVGHATPALTVDNIGTPLIYVNANSRFEIYVAQDIAAAISTGNSPLPDGSVICLSVGSALGLGLNKKATDIGTADTLLTALYRGDASVLDSGIDWGTANQAAQDAFWAQLEAQRITVAAEATEVEPAYTSNLA
tara:strand:- start:2398 stop:2901 length:504 start_codon:yes stop_codon:yes gene_type:complete